jgi:hypothetical protein
MIGIRNDLFVPLCCRGHRRRAVAGVVKVTARAGVTVRVVTGCLRGWVGAGAATAWAHVLLASSQLVVPWRTCVQKVRFFMFAGGLVVVVVAVEGNGEVRSD